MSRLVLILFISILFSSCQNKNTANITSIENNDIVGDFDRDKYPLIEEGIALGLEGKRDAAITKFNEAEKKYGQSVYISLNRGIIYKELKNLDKAIADYSVCIKLQPDYYPALVNRGIIYGYQDNFEKSIKDLNYAIKLKPNEPIGYIDRAVVYFMMKQKELGCKDLIEAKQNDLANNHAEAISEMENENCK
jgi:tetratricopeptide (TPR) repeat protein